jgi:hypothetical protein
MVEGARLASEDYMEKSGAIEASEETPQSADTLSLAAASMNMDGR